MVYNIANTFNIIGAGLSNQYLVSVLGNPIFPLIAIAIFLLIIYTIIFYWSGYDNKWKKFSVVSLISIIVLTTILFANKYFHGKKGKTIVGGRSNLPDSSYFMPSVSTTYSNEVAPDAAFSDLFD